VVPRGLFRHAIWKTLVNLDDERCSNSPTASRSIPMATPVFDGARETESATCSKWPDFRTPAQGHAVGPAWTARSSHSRSPSVTSTC